jgi:L-lactate dehydrogenase complex protein LldG
MTETAKEAILARIRAALDDAKESTPVPRAYQRRDERDRAAILGEFVDRLRDYRAEVERVNPAQLRDAITAACVRYAIRRLALPADVPEDWIPSGVEALRDDPPLTISQLDQSDGVLTGCALAVAQTGTIVLDGEARQGRRALSLVPDRHLCVVRADQVVGIVPEGIAHLAEVPTQPMTLISGPSATSDIELSRVEGVHGPRMLYVFLIDARLELTGFRGDL